MSKPSPAKRQSHRRSLTPHQKIMRAARRGTGLRLSAEEILQLSMDGAIATCAANDDEDAGVMDGTSRTTGGWIGQP